MTNRPHLQLTQLTKRFGEKTALHGVTFGVPGGSTTALLGPNGAGKSTLVACCTGLERPTSGSVEVLGRPAARSADDRAHVGVMLQEAGLPMQARPIPFLRHVARLYRNPMDLDDLVERLGIDEYSRTTMRRMSGGQRQRVAFAAAIMGRPLVAFLDEPTNGMDVHVRARVYDAIADLRASGCAIVLATHNMAEASALADDVVVLHGGNVIKQGKPDEIAGGADAGHTVFAASPALPLDTVRGVLAATRDITEDPDGTLRISGRLSAAEIHALSGAALQAGAEITELSFASASLEDAVQRMTRTQA